MKRKKRRELSGIGGSGGWCTQTGREWRCWWQTAAPRALAWRSCSTTGWCRVTHQLVACTAWVPARASPQTTRSSCTTWMTMADSLLLTARPLFKAGNCSVGSCHRHVDSHCLLQPAGGRLLLLLLFFSLFAKNALRGMCRRLCFVHQQDVASSRHLAEKQWWIQESERPFSSSASGVLILNSAAALLLFTVCANVRDFKQAAFFFILCSCSIIDFYCYCCSCKLWAHSGIYRLLATFDAPWLAWRIFADLLLLSFYATVWFMKYSV